MSIKTYTDAVDPAHTPQSEPIPGREAAMAENHAGGFSFVVDDWTRLDRFLVLGSDAPTYYASARKMTIENAGCVTRLLAIDGPRVVRTLVDVSTAGRAPRNDPAIFALALAMKRGDDATRKAAASAVPAVCRTGTHLFQLAAAVQALGGWGRGTKRAFSTWYTGQDEADLVYQVMKYQQREGWSHRDVLRLCKPAGYGPESRRGAIFRWATRGWDSIGEAPHPDEVLARLWAFERAKTADVAETCRLIRDYRLPRECVRTDALNDRATWDALLGDGRSGMPLGALVRNLAKMTAVGLLDPMSDATARVIARLQDADGIRKARLHPLALLVALRVYQQGHGEKGSLSWSPIAQVVDALDGAFYAAFGAVVPTGKRWLLGLDVSSSMSMGEVAGMTGITPRVGSAAMALVTAATEARHECIGFTGHGQVTRLDISATMRLDDVVRRISNLPFGATDCAIPMLYALQEKRDVDVFVVYTDNETWAGNVHPAVALQKYREVTGIPAKLIVVGMTATEFSIADPADAGMLDVAGFDTSAPSVMADFAR